MQLHAIIEGIVQHVHFRISTAQKATLLGVVGWVKNLDDKRVEVLAQGSGEKLHTLLEWLRVGPESARVDKIDHEFRDNDDMFDGFDIITDRNLPPIPVECTACGVKFFIRSLGDVACPTCHGEKVNLL